MVATLLAAAAAAAAVLAGLWAFWRYYWFWRNPPRRAPKGDHFLSPADGTVVYVHRLRPEEPVIACKQGLSVSINDIAREDLDEAKIHIGIFMSPFDVHYNRVPFDAVLQSSKQYPAEGRNVHMGSMHWRCMLRRPPRHANSPHLVQNNRAVTHFLGRWHGQPLSYYVVQIGGGGVHGIDVHLRPGEAAVQGDIFGMIRIGSQVDLILPDLPELQIHVQPGDAVRAGETILAVPAADGVSRISSGELTGVSPGRG